MEYLKKRGIGTRNYFPCIHLSPFYKKTFAFKEGDFPVTESFSDHALALPFFLGITDEQMRYVAQSLVEGIRDMRG
jgi:perosamine synthetase